MLELFTLNPETFGLDISDLSLKIIKLKKKKGFLSLVSFLEEKIPSGLIDGGEIKDEKSLAKIIKNALPKVKGEKLKTKYVIASLPEEKAFLEVIQMPKLAERDLKSAIIYEAENHIPLPLEEVYLDSHIVSPVVNHLDHLDVLLAALPKKTVDPYVSCLKMAGLIPEVLEIESLAVARALIKNGLSPFPALLADFGATRTSFVIFSGHSLRFTGSIPVSSQALTEALANILKVDLKTAERLKLKYGIQTGDKEKEKEIFEALIPALTDLKEQIKKYIVYYQAHTSHEHLLVDGKEVKKIFLSGGGAVLSGLTDFLSSELKIPVEIGNPWVNILQEPLREVPELPFEESLRYTTALGLALRGMKLPL